MNDARVVMEQVAGFLDADSVGYELLEDGRVIKTGFRGDVGLFKILISAMDDPLVMFLVTRIPLVVPEAKRLAIAEATTRINYGMTLGRFEMNMSTGDVNFYAAIPIIDSALTQEQLLVVLFAAIQRSQEQYRVFGRLLFDNDLTPAVAVAEFEFARRDAAKARQ